MAKTPEQFKQELMEMYGNQNTARLIRKAKNIENAKYREIASAKRRNQQDKTKWPSQWADIGEHREQYYSHRLHVLETILENRGLLPDFNGTYRRINQNG